MVRTDLKNMCAAKRPTPCSFRIEEPVLQLPDTRHQPLHNVIRWGPLRIKLLIDRRRDLSKGLSLNNSLHLKAQGYFNFGASRATATYHQEQELYNQDLTR